jgi:hypothetical protein
LAFLELGCASSDQLGGCQVRVWGRQEIGGFDDV